ncbi:MAG: NAD-dependent epimerase/dehydratase [Ilumatobacteraceae bacterium]|nr:NAD-dependent epimerase/dehydratase [Ilumatobacteraceae bacterium]
MPAADDPQVDRAWPSSVLVTGGAGFIGCNVVRRLVGAGSHVTVLDNLSRQYSRANAVALQRELGDGMRLIEGDVRNASVVASATGSVGAVVHLAGQTAVTRSIIDPHGDFLDNCVGTLNVLEAARLRSEPPIVLYSSTNKVYGDLEALEIVEEHDHYRFADLPQGVDETQPIDFASPYACSKGAGEQYVRDYARTYGVPTVVFRQSCIYGPHQLGAEDQGWLAWFLLAARANTPLTIYGDGKQVRDLLYVDDLIDCYAQAVAAIDVTAGQIYNVGGGAANSVSVWWQLKPMLERALGAGMADPSFGPWRLGDQRIFCADTRKATRDFGWSPTTAPADGLRRMVQWFDAREPSS